MYVFLDLRVLLTLAASSDKPLSIGLVSVRLSCLSLISAGDRQQQPPAFYIAIRGRRIDINL